MIEFVRAWVESAFRPIIAESLEMDCHVRVFIVVHVDVAVDVVDGDVM